MTCAIFWGRSLILFMSVVVLVLFCSFPVDWAGAVCSCTLVRCSLTAFCFGSVTSCLILIWFSLYFRKQRRFGNILHFNFISLPLQFLYWSLHMHHYTVIHTSHFKNLAVFTNIVQLMLFLRAGILFRRSVLHFWIANDSQPSLELALTLSTLTTEYTTKHESFNLIT